MRIPGPSILRPGFEVAMIQCSATCACGGGCPSCSETDKSSIQTKLTVSAPGDPLEQEADRVADHIMRVPSAHRVARGDGKRAESVVGYWKTGGLGTINEVNAVTGQTKNRR